MISVVEDADGSPWSEPDAALSSNSVPSLLHPVLGLSHSPHLWVDLRSGKRSWNIEKEWHHVVTAGAVAALTSIAVNIESCVRDNRLL